MTKLVQSSTTKKKQSQILIWVFGSLTPEQCSGGSGKGNSRELLGSTGSAHYQLHGRIQLPGSEAGAEKDTLSLMIVSNVNLLLIAWSLILWFSLVSSNP